MKFKLSAFFLILPFMADAYAQDSYAQESIPKPLTQESVPASTASLSDITQRMKFCAVTPENKARLECYDDISKLYRVKGEEEPGKEVKGSSFGTAQFAWTKTSSNEGQDIIVALQADDATIADKPLEKPAVAMAVRCQNASLQVFLVFDSEVGNKSAGVEIVIDDSPYKGNWSTALSGKSIGLWTNKESHDMADLLARSKKFNLKVSIRAGSLIAYFKSIDATQVLAPEIKLCGKVNK